MYGIDVELSDYHIGSSEITEERDGYYEGWACEVNERGEYGPEGCRTVSGRRMLEELVLFVGDEIVRSDQTSDRTPSEYGKLYFLDPVTDSIQGGKVSTYANAFEAIELVPMHGAEDGVAMEFVAPPTRAHVRFFVPQENVAPSTEEASDSDSEDLVPAEQDSTPNTQDGGAKPSVSSEPHDKTEPGVALTPEQTEGTPDASKESIPSDVIAHGEPERAVSGGVPGSVEEPDAQVSAVGLAGDGVSLVAVPTPEKPSVEAGTSLLEETHRQPSDLDLAPSGDGERVPTGGITQESASADPLLDVSEATLDSEEPEEDIAGPGEDEKHDGDSLDTSRTEDKAQVDDSLPASGKATEGEDDALKKDDQEKSSAPGVEAHTADPNVVGLPVDGLDSKVGALEGSLQQEGSSGPGEEDRTDAGTEEIAPTLPQESGGADLGVTGHTSDSDVGDASLTETQKLQDQGDSETV